MKLDFEKIEPKKKVGDMTCEKYFCAWCDKCPLKCLACEGNLNNTLREKLEATLKKYPQLEPMRSYFEKELDKEIE